MLRDNITQQQYIDQYRRMVLSRVDQAVMLKDLERLTGGRDCALLCYEKPGDFCHRRLLADWMLETTGLEIPEFGQEKKPDLENSVEQLTLF